MAKRLTCGQVVFNLSLADRNLISALEFTPDPILIAGVWGMAERGRSMHRHGLEKVEICDKAWVSL